MVLLSHYAFPNQGIYVTRVTPGGPAEVAGLRMGDKIMQVCVSFHKLLTCCSLNKATATLCPRAGIQYCDFVAIIACNYPFFKV